MPGCWRRSICACSLSAYMSITVTGALRYYSTHRLRYYSKNKQKQGAVLLMDIICTATTGDGLHESYGPGDESTHVER